MLQSFLNVLEGLDNHLWSYVGFPLIMAMGIYLSFKSNFVQIRKFPYIVKTFWGFLKIRKEANEGVHPLKAFFACIGGCVGIGNIVAICTAVQIGGPGALFWIWVTAIVGMVIKYAEVYLGILHRVPNAEGGYNGGPMYFLQKTFKSRWIPAVVAILICIYGIEIYQFSVMSNSIAYNFDLNPLFVTLALLGMVLYAVSGGIERVGKISSTVIPVLILLYLAMGTWVLVQNISLIPGVFAEVFSSAFTGHAAVGGFAGSSLMLAISQGIRRGCYTADVGVGYASIIHSESCEKVPEKQAGLVIFDVFLDTFAICTTSILLTLVTGLWKEPIHESLLVQTALSLYFPYMEYFMPLFLFLLGYSTIIAYFCVGLKCAQFLSPKRGKPLYYLYATVGLFLFSFIETSQALIVMSITQFFLIVINLTGIFRLQKQLSFSFGEEKEMELSRQNSEAK